LAAILDAIPIDVAYSDDPSKHIRGNPALLHLYQTSETNLSSSAPESEAVGPNVRYVRDGRPLTPEELPLQQAIAERRVLPPVDTEIILPDGRRWICEALGAPIFDMDGNLVAGLSVAVDVTERR
jgi:PAS domain-containing protein